MRIAIAGGTGLVGRFVVNAALEAGHRVTLLSRREPAPGAFDGAVAHLPHDLLTAAPDLSGHDALIHAAFQHVPGRYRGGEGDDPAGFLAANLDGSTRLFAAARAAGVGRVVFLSSRAVYGPHPPGTVLEETTPPRPDTLYGQMKLAAETVLAGLAGPDFVTASLRATGVYGPAGPGQRHKWADLFAEFQAGRTPAPRLATEVHGADLARAALLLLDAGADAVSGLAFNVSDLLLDRHELLAEVAGLTGWPTPLPPRADGNAVNAMATGRLRALGWQPGGWGLLRASLPAMLRAGLYNSPAPTARPAPPSPTQDVAAGAVLRREPRLG